MSCRVQESDKCISMGTPHACETHGRVSLFPKTGNIREGSAETLDQNIFNTFIPYFGEVAKKLGSPLNPKYVANIVVDIS